MIKTELSSTVDGIRAVELFYRPIRNTESNELEFFTTQMHLNGPTMGVLMPEDFVPVIELSEQCIYIFRLGFVQLLQAVCKFISREIDFKWASIYMPVRFLKRIDAVRSVLSCCEKFKVPADKVCFELSLDLLDESDPRASENLDVLRKKGFHFMIEDFGSRNCPVLRLADFNVDYVLLDSSVTRILDNGSRSDSCVNSLVNYVNDLNAEPIAENIFSDDQREKLYEFGCQYYTGEKAGKFVAERYVRKRKD